MTPLRLCFACEQRVADALRHCADGEYTHHCRHTHAVLVAEVKARKVTHWTMLGGENPLELLEALQS